MSNIQKILRVVICLSQLIPLGITLDTKINSIQHNSDIVRLPLTNAIKLEHDILKARLHHYKLLHHPHHIARYNVPHLPKHIPHVELLPILRAAPNDGENADINSSQTVHTDSKNQRNPQSNTNEKSSSEEVSEQQPIIFALKTLNDAQTPRDSANQQQMVLEELPTHIINLQNLKNNVNENEFRSTLDSNQDHFILIQGLDNSILQDTSGTVLQGEKSTTGADQFHFIIVPNTDSRISQSAKLESNQNNAIKNGNSNQVQFLVFDNKQHSQANVAEFLNDQSNNKQINGSPQSNVQNTNMDLINSQSTNGKNQFNIFQIPQQQQQQLNHMQVSSGPTTNFQPSGQISSNPISQITKLNSKFEQESNQNQPNFGSSSSTDQTRFTSDKNFQNFNTFEPQQKSFTNNVKSHIAELNPLSKVTDMPSSIQQNQFSSRANAQDFNTREVGINPSTSPSNDGSVIQSTNIGSNVQTQFSPRVNEQDFNSNFESSQFNPNNQMISRATSSNASPQTVQINSRENQQMNNMFTNDGSQNQFSFRANEQDFNNGEFSQNSFNDNQFMSQTVGINPSTTTTNIGSNEQTQFSSRTNEQDFNNNFQFSQSNPSNQMISRATSSNASPQTVQINSRENQQMNNVFTSDGNQNQFSSRANDQNFNNREFSQNSRIENQNTPQATGLNSSTVTANDGRAVPLSNTGSNEQSQFSPRANEQDFNNNFEFSQFNQNNQMISRATSSNASPQTVQINSRENQQMNNVFTSDGNQNQFSSRANEQDFDNREFSQNSFNDNQFMSQTVGINPSTITTSDGRVIQSTNIGSNEQTQFSSRANEQDFNNNFQFSQFNPSNQMISRATSSNTPPQTLEINSRENQQMNNMFTGDGTQNQFSSRANDQDFNNRDFSQNSPNNNQIISQSIGLNPSTVTTNDGRAVPISNIGSNEQPQFTSRADVQDFNTRDLSQNSFNVDHMMSQTVRMDPSTSKTNDERVMPSTNMGSNAQTQFSSRANEQDFNNNFQFSQFNPNNQIISRATNSNASPQMLQINPRENQQINNMFTSDGIQNQFSTTGRISSNTDLNVMRKSSLPENLQSNTRARSQTQSIIANTDIVLPLENEKPPTRLLPPNENFPPNIHPSLPSTHQLNPVSPIVTPVHVIPHSNPIQSTQSNLNIQHVPHITPVHIVQPTSHQNTYKSQDSDESDEAERAAHIIRNGIFSNQFIAPSQFIPPFVSHNVFGSPTNSFAQASATSTNFNNGGFIPQNSFGSSSSFAQASSGTTGFNQFRQMEENGNTGSQIVGSPYVVQIPPFPNPHFHRIAKRSVAENITSNSLIPIFKDLEDIFGNETSAINKPIKDLEKFLEKHPISEKIKFEETKDGGSLLKSEFSAHLPLEFLKYFEEPKVNRSKRTLALLRLLTARTPVDLNSPIENPVVGRQATIFQPPQTHLPFYHLQNAVGSFQKAAASAVNTPLLLLFPGSYLPNENSNFEPAETNNIVGESNTDSIEQTEQISPFRNNVIQRKSSSFSKNVPISPTEKIITDENRSALLAPQQQQTFMVIRPLRSRSWNTQYPSRRILLIANPIHPQQIIRTSSIGTLDGNFVGPKWKHDTSPNTFKQENSETNQKQMNLNNHRNAEEESWKHKHVPLNTMKDGSDDISHHFGQENDKTNHNQINSNHHINSEKESSKHKHYPLHTLKETNDNNINHNVQSKSTNSKEFFENSNSQQSNRFDQNDPDTSSFIQNSDINSIENIVSEDSINERSNEKPKQKLSKDEAENVGTSMEFTSIMTTPFGGMATPEQIRDFYSEHNSFRNFDR